MPGDPGGNKPDDAVLFVYGYPKTLIKLTDYGMRARRYAVVPYLFLSRSSTRTAGQRPPVFPPALEGNQAPAFRRPASDWSEGVSLPWSA